MGGQTYPVLAYPAPWLWCATFCHSTASRVDVASTDTQAAAFAVICRAEARRVEALRPKIEAKGIRLACLVRVGFCAASWHIVRQGLAQRRAGLQVHEMLPGEIKAFRHFWPGEVYLDAEKAFYLEVSLSTCKRSLWLDNSCVKQRPPPSS